MPNHKVVTYDRGLQAERLAALWLRIKGYKILAERYKTSVGEIDLIIQKKNTLAFVEVKARQTHEQALESLTPNMRRRIEKAALSYCAYNNIEGFELRFDLITVQPPFFIHHLDNAWLQGT